MRGGALFQGPANIGRIIALRPAAFYDFSSPTGYTIDASRRIAAALDLSGNARHATQGTDANKPLLSRADNLENLAVWSEDISKEGAGLWGSTRADPVAASTTEVKEDATVANTHYVSQSLPAVVAGVTYRYAVSVKRGAGARDACLRIDSGGSLARAFINLTTGAISSTTGSTVAWASGPTSAADGDYWRITGTVTAPASGASSILVFLADGENLSYNGDNTSTIHITRAQAQLVSASPTYIATGAVPIYSGLNGRSVAVLDGSNDDFATSYAVNPTGGLCTIAVVRPAAAALQAIATSYDGANTRMQFLMYADGSVSYRVASSDANIIGRKTAAGAYTAGESAVWTGTYDGGTLSSGIKIFKNGVQVDTADAQAGTYTLPGAGANLRVGSQVGTIPLNGKLLALAVWNRVLTGYERCIAEYALSANANVPIAQDSWYGSGDPPDRDEGEMN